VLYKPLFPYIGTVDKLQGKPSGLGLVVCHCFLFGNHTSFTGSTPTCVIFFLFDLPLHHATLYKPVELNSGRNRFPVFTKWLWYGEAVPFSLFRQSCLYSNYSPLIGYRSFCRPQPRLLRVPSFLLYQDFLYKLPNHAFFCFILILVAHALKGCDRITLPLSRIW
jgi:hypothetical protein